jgi:hypothetical protein
MLEVSSLWSNVYYLSPRIELWTVVCHTVTFQKTLILVLAAVRTSSYVDEIESSDFTH